jgi:hypothetical protein
MPSMLLAGTSMLEGNGAMALYPELPKHCPACERLLGYTEWNRPAPRRTLKGKLLYALAGLMALMTRRRRWYEPRANPSYARGRFFHAVYHAPQFVRIRCRNCGWSQEMPMLDLNRPVGKTQYDLIEAERREGF